MHVLAWGPANSQDFDLDDAEVVSAGVLTAMNSSAVGDDLDESRCAAAFRCFCDFLFLTIRGCFNVCCDSSSSSASQSPSSSCNSENTLTLMKSFSVISVGLGIADFLPLATC